MHLRQVSVTFTVLTVFSETQLPVYKCYVHHIPEFDKERLYLKGIGSEGTLPFPAQRTEMKTIC